MPSRTICQGIPFPLDIRPHVCYPPSSRPPTDPKQMPQTGDSSYDPITDPDTQEALSIRYSNSTVLIVPLRSGNFAIFGRDFQLHTILDEAPSTSDLRRISAELQVKLSRRRAEEAFYGAPDDKTLARDLKRLNNPFVRPVLDEATPIREPKLSKPPTASRLVIPTTKP